MQRYLRQLLKEAGIPESAIKEPTHTKLCDEYWDRGLNCSCIPVEEQVRILVALKRGDSVDDVIDPGWGQFD